MNTNDKIKLGTNILKAIIAGAAKNRSRRSNDTAKQNTNVSGCGGCSRSENK